MEVYALLDLLQDENKKVFKVWAFACADLLERVVHFMNILDPNHPFEMGDKDLISAVAAEVTRLRALSA
jgi:hypothetical protein